MGPKSDGRVPHQPHKDVMASPQCAHPFCPRGARASRQGCMGRVACMCRNSWPAPCAANVLLTRVEILTWLKFGRTPLPPAPTTSGHATLDSLTPAARECYRPQVSTIPSTHTHSHHHTHLCLLGVGPSKQKFYLRHKARGREREAERANGRRVYWPWKGRSPPVLRSQPRATHYRHGGLASAASLLQASVQQLRGIGGRSRHHVAACALHCLSVSDRSLTEMCLVASSVSRLRKSTTAASALPRRRASKPTERHSLLSAERGPEWPDGTTPRRESAPNLAVLGGVMPTKPTAKAPDNSSSASGGRPIQRADAARPRALREARAWLMGVRGVCTYLEAACNAPD